MFEPRAPVPEALQRQPVQLAIFPLIQIATPPAVQMRPPERFQFRAFPGRHSWHDRPSCPFYLIDPSFSWAPAWLCGGYNSDLRSAGCQALWVCHRIGRFGHGKARRGAAGITCPGVTDRSRPCRSRLRLGSGREPFVSMMKAADLRESDNLARTRWAGRTRLWAVLGERQVSPGSMVIVEVG